MFGLANHIRFTKLFPCQTFLLLWYNVYGTHEKKTLSTYEKHITDTVNLWQLLFILPQLRVDLIQVNISLAWNLKDLDYCASEKVSSQGRCTSCRSLP